MPSIHLRALPKFMARPHSIAVIGGDGIGPEVTQAALRVLDAAERRFGFSTSREEYPWSSARYVESGAHVKRPEDIDIVVVRENTEDVYTQPGTITGAGKDEVGVAPMRFTRPGIERIVRYAFELARARPKKHLTLVDKSNAIPIQELWRRIFDEVGASYPGVRRDAMYVDACCMWMVQKPEQFDVIVTTNLIGDIITDLGAGIAGGLGIAASGNIHPGKTSMFEPIHGSAPKYAGQGVASPLGAIGALAMLLRHVGERDAGDAVERAIAEGLRSGKIRGVEAGAQETD